MAFIDVKTQCPVGHGAVICFSVYGGPDVDFGRGFEAAEVGASGLEMMGVAKKDRLWVDVWSEVVKDKEGRPILKYGKVSSRHNRIT